MLDLNSTDKATPNSDVIVTELDGEAVLLNLDTRMYFTLNETGLTIWKQLTADETLGNIAQRLHDDYDVTIDKARQSVFQLVSELSKEQLISLERG
jgi:hypothetical protein